MDKPLVSEYAFGTGTARFHICRGGGVVPVVTSEIDGRLYAVVSVNTFDKVDRSMISSAPISFDGEGTDSRLARRQRNWIPEVEIMEAAG